MSFFPAIAASLYRGAQPVQQRQQRPVQPEKRDCSNELAAYQAAANATKNALTAYQTATAQLEAAYAAGVNATGGVSAAATAALAQQERTLNNYYAAVAAEQQAQRLYSACMNPFAGMDRQTLAGHMEQGGWGRRRSRKGSRRSRKGSRRSRKSM